MSKCAVLAFVFLHISAETDKLGIHLDVGGCVKKKKNGALEQKLITSWDSFATSHILFSSYVFNFCTGVNCVFVMPLGVILD